MPIVLLSLVFMKRWNRTLWKYMMINDYFMAKTDSSVFKDPNSLKMAFRPFRSNVTGSDHQVL